MWNIKLNLALKVDELGSRWKCLIRQDWWMASIVNIGDGRNYGSRSSREKRWVLNAGLAHGQWLQYLEGQVKSLEEELALVSGSTLKQEAVECKLAALSKDVDGVLEEPLGPDPPDQARAVLQTYTVSLTEVKKDINLWKEPLQAEMEALVSSGTIRRVRACEAFPTP